MKISGRFSVRISLNSGSGIFNSDGLHWYKQRKLSAKIFTARTFKSSFKNVFSSTVNSFVERLDNSLGQTVDMHDLFHRYFLDSFSLIAFSVRMHLSRSI